MVALTGCLMCIFLFRTSEPSYHGKTLSQLIATSHVGGGKSQFDDELMRGLSAMGTNAYPAVFKLVSARDGVLRTKIINFVNHQGLVQIRMRTAADKQKVAEYVFHYFGTNMVSAVPGLIPLTRDPDPQVRRCAVSCLIATEPERNVMLPVLTEHLPDSDQLTSQAAAAYIQARYPDEARELRVSKYLRYSAPFITTNSGTNVTVIWVRTTIGQ